MGIWVYDKYKNLLFTMLCINVNNRFGYIYSIFWVYSKV